MKYSNPILRGFHPDPSICRVGEDFYLATSTFTYYPGVPVYHSKNLTEWSLIGHCLTSSCQICLNYTPNSKGIYAPTLRYYDHLFYMITTDVGGRGNFIVHAKEAKGPWSDPVAVDQDGIDPSLFWDDDGTCWYCGKGTLHGERGIIGFILNPMTGEQLSPKVLISKGCGGKCAEGPHIMKREGWYYLITAEGGTQYSHRSMIQRSRTIDRDYVPCPHNPILSHEEQNHRPIQAVGHADLFEDQHGNWWCVCLGIRMFDDLLLHNLGRETLLVPVKWQDGWPVCGANGSVEMLIDGPLPVIEEKVGSENGKIWMFDYASDSIPLDFYYIRDTNLNCYKLWEGQLLIEGVDVSLNEEMGSPSCMLVPQQEFGIQAVTCLNLTESTASRYGMTVYYSNNNHYDIAVETEKNALRLVLYKHIYDMGATAERVHIPDDTVLVWISVKADKKGYYFYYSLDKKEWKILGQGTIAAMCTETMMERSYTGTMVGLFAEKGLGVFSGNFTVLKEELEWKAEAGGKSE